MRSIAHLCVAFFGISLIVSGLEHLGRTETTVVTGDGEIIYTAIPAGISLAISLIFMFVPGAYVLSRREAIARWLSPETDPEADRPDSFSLYCLGMCLLGLYFSVAGGGSLLVGVVQLVFWLQADSKPYLYPWALSGVVQLVAGIWMFRTGRARLGETGGAV